MVWFLVSYPHCTVHHDLLLPSCMWIVFFVYVPQKKMATKLDDKKINTTNKKMILVGLDESYPP